ncbi:hypothetical protein V1525DRAFT_426786 [Lipomyces kononenkoae]|uniref:Uncharacterized protein n=1 Tax=Lipomyces kononenkoae TaxID=34357 RepID=A0ACC3SZI0_LIPKO
MAHRKILKNCRRYFDRVAHFDDFMKQIQKAASTIDPNSQEEELNQLRDNFPPQAVDYFFTQWWANSTCKAWAEIHIRNYVNFGVSSTSRVEGSHGAMKTALTSSSGTLYTATTKKKRRESAQSRTLSIVGSNQNVRVRLEIRNQVLKKLEHKEEQGTDARGSCTIRTRFLLPCSHQIVLGQPIHVASIHPRWRVQPTLPDVDIPSQDIDTAMISQFHEKDDRKDKADPRRRLRRFKKRLIE